ncbi:KTSC domain-containing protein [Streptomyces sp. NPDC042898]|uniref:KTSC domain-containing protein n=1 Tax=Streptomyces sp. NPDC042898 TaxID=3154334 RepID=UPI003403D5B6
MLHQAVVSSNVKSIAYDAPSCVLEVKFKSGAVYRYYNVPVAIHELFLEADSKGRYLARHIKGKFRFRMIAPPA